MSDDKEEDEEGFSGAFSRAYTQSSGALGQLLGGCTPWLVALCVFLLAVALISIAVFFLWDTYRR
jgi:hypothetical protein